MKGHRLRRRRRQLPIIELVQRGHAGELGGDRSARRGADDQVGVSQVQALIEQTHQEAQPPSGAYDAAAPQHQGAALVEAPKTHALQDATSASTDVTHASRPNNNSHVHLLGS